ncbi:diaminopimelate epimerase [uncultured Lutibacter sp.]|uniref:diaminopimelate epimerase n=1 Tax=uncultured Lutibacter sp. TaxID=437739 RepID=UPI002638C7C0|nr:diaminopimelate epimerase [uncultured Lutibacter sp.]
MNQQFFKYQGTGNDFIMIDNRSLLFPKENAKLINKLCDRRFGIGADGLILLEPSIKEDFTMVYFNADGKEGSMCGNGGRCLVAFAKQLNIIDKNTTFDAVDGLHHATIENNIVSLKMIDVYKVETNKDYSFLNTGSPHHISFTNNVSIINVKELGAKIRYGAPYFNEGTNVNFAEKLSDNSFKVRTYERGVEDETLACGTGVTAVAIAAHNANITSKNHIKIEVLGGNLEVSFNKEDGIYNNVYLKGPAKFVFEGIITI